MSAFGKVSLKHMERKKIQSETGIMNWKQDLITLSEELPRLHKNLFFRRNEWDMKEEILELEKEIPYLTDDEILAAFTRWVASVGDSHTKIHGKRERIFPLAFYWFEEGIYVTHTSPEYSYLQYGQLEGVGGESITSVIERLRPLISYENEYLFQEELPRLLNSPQILHGVKLASRCGEITYQMKTGEGKRIDAVVTQCTDGIEAFYEVGPIGMGGSKYAKNNSIPYWFEYMESHKILYFQYNQCVEDSAFPHELLMQELLFILNEKQVEKFVIDLRYNQGGSSYLLKPFLDKIPNLKALKRFQKLYAIMGRATFSSAFLHLIWLKMEKAILLGQPSGSKPNFYGELGFFELANSRLMVSYSTCFFHFFKKDKVTLMPDYLFPTTFADYLANHDPVMDFILRQ